MQTPEQLPSERSLVLTAPLETTSSWQKCPLASSRLSSSGWKASLQRRLLAHPHLCPQHDHPAKITHYNWELLPRHPLPFAFVPFRETDARRERQGEGERRDLILYKLGRAASRQDAPPGLLHLWDWWLSGVRWRRQGQQEGAGLSAGRSVQVQRAEAAHGQGGWFPAQPGGGPSLLCGCS